MSLHDQNGGKRTVTRKLLITIVVALSSLASSAGAEPTSITCTSNIEEPDGSYAIYRLTRTYGLESFSLTEEKNGIITLFSDELSCNFSGLLFSCVQPFYNFEYHSYELSAPYFDEPFYELNHLYLSNFHGVDDEPIVNSLAKDLSCSVE
jgi:hypothetical protein